MREITFPIKSMLQAYKEGKSVEDIAQWLGGEDRQGYWRKTLGKTYRPDAKTVYKVLLRHGCKFRSEGARPGDKHWNWQGGTFIEKAGYVMQLCPDHPNCNAKGYVRQHRLVIEAHIGRYLTEEEVVHHIDVCKSNNDLANLILFANNSEHLAYELKGIAPKYIRDRQEKGLI